MILSSHKALAQQILKTFYLYSSQTYFSIFQKFRGGKGGEYEKWSKLQ